LESSVGREFVFFCQTIKDQAETFGIEIVEQCELVGHGNVAAGLVNKLQVSAGAGGKLRAVLLACQ